MKKNEGQEGNGKSKLKGKEYTKELRRLQANLCHLQLPPDRSIQKPALLRASAHSLDPIHWPGNVSPPPVEKNGTYRACDQRPASNSFLSTARKILASNPGIALGRTHDSGQMRKPDASIFDRASLTPPVNGQSDRRRQRPGRNNRPRNFHPASR